MQQRAEILQRGAVRQAARGHLVGYRQQCRAVLRGQRVQHADQIRLVERPQHALHRIQRDLAGSIGNGLIRERQGVAHRTVRALRQQTQRRRFEFDAFLPQNVIQMAHDMAGRHLLQVELQTARQHSHRNFLRIGRGQDEFDVLGGFFQRFQHGIERMIGEHVHFVDHVDLEARVGRRVHRLLQQLRHFVHAAIGGGIHFDVIDETPGVDRHASFAHAAWPGGDIAGAVGADAIEGFGQNARKCGFTDTARPCKQIGVMQPFLLQRMGQRAHDVFLPDERIEIPGAVLAGEDLIRHRYGLAGDG